MAVVVFDYTAWTQQFPEFLPAVTLPMAQGYFTTATMFVNNTDTSPVTDPVQRAQFLNLVVAHLAKLYGPGASGLVGRIEQAQEGTVNVKTALEGDNQNRAFWSQTVYGLTYWQISARFRLGRYVPGPVRSFSPYPGPYPYGWGR